MGKYHAKKAHGPVEADCGRRSAAQQDLEENYHQMQLRFTTTVLFMFENETKRYSTARPPYMNLFTGIAILPHLHPIFPIYVLGTIFRNLAYPCSTVVALRR